jgi:hypothetical protein
MMFAMDVVMAIGFSVQFLPCVREREREEVVECDLEPPELYFRVAVYSCFMYVVVDHGARAYGGMCQVQGIGSGCVSCRSLETHNPTDFFS